MPKPSAPLDDTFFDAQALRMLSAFFKIRDQGSRTMLIHLAEAAERGAIIDVIIGETFVTTGASDGKVIQLPTRDNPSNRNR